MKQSAATIAKRAASMRAHWADPERKAKHAAAAAAGLRRWHSDPANAAAFAERSSERMKRRHADPEWQKIRDARSARTMRANWQKHRESYVAAALARYWRERAAGLGLNSPEAKRAKAAAAKWIMKQAQAALHAETDFDRVYRRVCHRLRREMPYDGPGEPSDYADYLSKLDRAICTYPEIRALADEFMSEAIPRFAEQWRTRKELKP